VLWRVSSESTDGLGRRLKRWRQLHGLRISDVGAKTGLAVSTISKVENGAMSLTYDKLLQLATGLSIDIAELFHDAGAVETTQRPVTARRSVSRPSQEHYVSAGFYEYWYLNTDLSRKMMTPMIGQVHARTLEEFGELIRHPGEEFLMVIEGAIVVHTEFYTPVVLHVGETLYIDSNMGHAYLALDGQIGRFVVVCAGDNDDGGMASVKRKAERDLASISASERETAESKTPRPAARTRKAKA
jgi:transcriptional regulator with XRE-family HTH domain